MRIRSAIGLAILIIVLRFLVPKIAYSIQDTILALLDTLRRVISAAQVLSQPPYLP